MWPVSPALLAAIRHSHTRVTTCTHRNLITGQTTPLPVLDGTVTIDATAAVRRTLNLTTAGTASMSTQAVFDALDTPGGEITVTQTIRTPDHHSETVPLGVFIVDQDALNYSPTGAITMTCPDRWLKVQRNKFGLSRASVPSNPAWAEIKRLVEGAWPGSVYPFPGWSLLDESATAKVGSLVWADGDREAAINGIAAGNSVEVFFDPTGQAVLRPVPFLDTSSAPVWTVDADGKDAILMDADRARDMSKTRDAVIVSSSATDVPFQPVLVQNTTPGDPLNVTGPLGFVPYYWSTPIARTAAQGTAAGLTILRRQLGVAKQLTLTAFSNPALDAEDVILVKLPRIDRNTPRPVELHITDTITTPLMPSGSQPIATRSTRPASDGT